MKMKREGRCNRISLAVYTFVFMVSGLLLLAFGINLYVKEGPFATLLPSFPFLNAANLIIIIGTIVLCVSIIGCVGAWKENTCLLVTFFMSLFVIFLLEMMAGYLGFVYRNQVERFVMEELTTHGLQRYGQRGEAGLTSAWDRMQTMLMCCGVDQSSDWHMFTPYYGQGQTPDSCCFSYNVGCGDNPSEEKWYMGCRESLIMEIEGNIDVITIVAICVALLEVLGMCLSYCLYKSLREKTDQGDDLSI
ncbi:tetraspanin-9-like [Apostichopus japonicus]|uniref:tetraspanin-9-like n=1 Tax=Stichopus japonicus TaxID=307972 RepID=UPI003AB3A355